MISSDLHFKFLLERAELKASAHKEELETYCKFVYGKQSGKSTRRIGKSL